MGREERALRCLVQTVATAPPCEASPPKEYARKHHGVPDPASGRATLAKPSEAHESEQPTARLILRAPCGKVSLHVENHVDVVVGLYRSDMACTQFLQSRSRVIHAGPTKCDPGFRALGHFCRRLGGSRDQSLATCCYPSTDVRIVGTGLNCFRVHGQRGTSLLVCVKKVASVDVISALALTT